MLAEVIEKLDKINTIASFVQNADENFWDSLSLEDALKFHQFLRDYSFKNNISNSLTDRLFKIIEIN